VSYGLKEKLGPSLEVLAKASITGTRALPSLPSPLPKKVVGQALAASSEGGGKARPLRCSGGGSLLFEVTASGGMAASTATANGFCGWPGCRRCEEPGDG
jgi:hypothetical protein